MKIKTFTLGTEDPLPRKQWKKIQSVTPEQTTYYYLNPILLMRKLSEVKKNIKEKQSWDD